MSAVHYDSFTEARTHLKSLLDAAGKGRLATVRRDSSTAVVLDAERLRNLLVAATAARVQVVPESGGWSVFIPGMPVAADGATFDEAMDEMVDALREYAADWQERLLDIPNHEDNWAVVALVGLSDDDQLREWIIA